MSNLAQKQCVPCKGGIPPLKGKALEPLFQQLKKGWALIQEHHLEKNFTFKNFKEALVFTNKIGGLAEAQGHHPDIHLSWGNVKIILWTHKINGLSESDFILAAKIDQI